MFAFLFCFSLQYFYFYFFKTPFLLTIINLYFPIIDYLLKIIAFAFFADPIMQSFYRRFIRDYMRYRDDIQCLGAELVGAVRADAKRLLPSSMGEYYALHIRRGDFQFKVRETDGEKNRQTER